MIAIRKTGMRFVLGSALWLLAGHSARAQLLDDIEITPLDGNTEVRINLTAPVRYLRHFPPERGDLINVYFRHASVDSMESPVVREERMRSPATPRVPSFTVSVTNFGTTDNSHDLYLAIQFKQPVSFKLRQGSDNRSFILTIPAPHALDEPSMGAVSGSRTFN